MDFEPYEPEESHIKADTRRNSTTYKHARGALQIANFVSNRKWSKNRFAGYRNDKKAFMKNHENAMFPDSKSSKKRDIWNSPKDSTGNNSLLSRSEIEDFISDHDRSELRDKIVYSSYKSGIVHENNVIRALKHGKKRLSYRV